MATERKAKASTKSASGITTLTLNDMGLSIDQRVSTSKATFSLWVRTLLQNWRQGTVSCKGRADVSRSNKKPWKQKGTGRARAGTARSPLWRGGGVTFGPQPRTRILSISKKMKQRVLNTMFFDALDKGKIKQLDWVLEGATPKTSQAYKALKSAELLNNKSLTLFLSMNDILSYASFSNIPTVRIVFFDQANAFDLARSSSWVCLKKDMDAFKEMVSRWI